VLQYTDAFTNSELAAYLKVLYKTAAAADCIRRVLVMAVSWTNPDVAVIAENNRCPTRQVVKVRLAAFYQ